MDSIVLKQLKVDCVINRYCNPHSLIVSNVEKKVWFAFYQLMSSTHYLQASIIFNPIHYLFHVLPCAENNVSILHPNTHHDN